MGLSASCFGLGSSTEAGESMDGACHPVTCTQMPHHSAQFSQRLFYYQLTAALLHSNLPRTPTGPRPSEPHNNVIGSRGGRIDQPMSGDLLDTSSVFVKSDPSRLVTHPDPPATIYQRKLPPTSSMATTLVLAPQLWPFACLAAMPAIRLSALLTSLVAIGAETTTPPSPAAAAASQANAAHPSADSNVDTGQLPLPLMSDSDIGQALAEDLSVYHASAGGARGASGDAASRRICTRLSALTSKQDPHETSTATAVTSSLPPFNRFRAPSGRIYLQFTAGVEGELCSNGLPELLLRVATEQPLPELHLPPVITAADLRQAPGCALTLRRLLRLDPWIREAAARAACRWGLPGQEDEFVGDANARLGKSRWLGVHEHTTWVMRQCSMMMRFVDWGRVFPV